MISQLRLLLKNTVFRTVLVAAIILGTLGIFTWYIINNPQVLNSLRGLSPILLLLLTAGYIGTIAANALILYSSLQLLKKQTTFTENILLTSYSSVINFFGPLQSGPGARAVYLKAKHGVRLRDFAGLTMIFYGFFGVLNASVIAVAALVKFPSVVTLLLGILGLVALAFGVRFIARRNKRSNIGSLHFWLIAIGAFLLSISTLFIYFFEINQVGSGVSLIQVAVYTAAANLSLFVSLTPGAIGFREAFLVFTQQLHGISTDVIVAANILDRAFYVVFLLVLFVAVIAYGRHKKLAFFSRNK